MDYLRLLCFVSFRSHSFVFFKLFQPSVASTLSMCRFSRCGDVGFSSVDFNIFQFGICMHLMRMAHAQTHRDNVGWKFLLNDDDYDNDVDHHSIIQWPHAHIISCRSFQPNERRKTDGIQWCYRKREREREKIWRKENYVCSYQNISLWSLTEQREMNVSFTRMHMRCSKHTDELKHTKHNKYVSICSAIIPHTQLWQCMLCAHSV